MYQINTKKMHTDILKRLNEINKPQRFLTQKLGISRATFWRLGLGKDITLQTFIKLLNWLQYEPGRYIIFKKSKKWQTLKHLE